MLVLSRNCNESIMIGDDVEVTVVEVRGNKVRLGVKAPDQVKVFRRELWEQRRNNSKPDEPGPPNAPPDAPA